MSSADIAAHQPSGAAELRRPDGQPVRVLVVDDEASLTELLDGAAVRGLGDPDRR